ncbi:hypothetical protein KY320_02340 [Candidatus Woesearchaeota archaeon]|nr:hypothetical protein [Candidatus Woesearchaeota archaeon]
MGIEGRLFFKIDRVLFLDLGAESLQLCRFKSGSYTYDFYQDFAIAGNGDVVPQRTVYAFATPLQTQKDNLLGDFLMNFSLEPEIGLYVLEGTPTKSRRLLLRIGPWLKPRAQGYHKYPIVSIVDITKSVELQSTTLRGMFPSEDNASLDIIAGLHGLAPNPEYTCARYAHAIRNSLAMKKCDAQASRE